jgi:hypothetical protein
MKNKQHLGRGTKNSHVLDRPFGGAIVYFLVPTHVLPITKRQPTVRRVYEPKMELHNRKRCCAAPWYGEIA